MRTEFSEVKLKWRPHYGTKKYYADLTFNMIVLNDLNEALRITAASVDLIVHQPETEAKVLQTLTVHPEGTGPVSSGSRPLDLRVGPIDKTDIIKCHTHEAESLRPSGVLGNLEVWLTLEAIGKTRKVRMLFLEEEVNTFDFPPNS